jgi:hypothetical protein
MWRVYPLGIGKIEVEGWAQGNFPCAHFALGHGCGCALFDLNTVDGRWSMVVGKTAYGQWFETLEMTCSHGKQL